MSFSVDIKNEVAKLDSSREELISELSAIVRNSAIINDGSVSITIENNSVARRIFKLFKNVYDITPVITVRRKYFNNGYSYILDIRKNVEKVLYDLSIIGNDGYLSIPSEYIYSDDDLVRAYLRGIFLSSGSITDPKTSKYHLELVVDSLEYANFVSRLLNDNDLNSRVIARDKKYMVYIKEAEKISDFLRIIKAYNAVMYYEDIRIYRDHKNMTNRLNNCEQANMDKIFLTSSKQLKDIEILKKYDMIDLLDEKLKH